jgi:hypothetical protein
MTTRTDNTKAVQRARLVTGILGWVVGIGLILGGSASNGFQTCGTGGVGRGGDANSAAPCGSLTWPLTIAGLIVIIAGMVAAFALPSVVGRLATRHSGRPGSADSTSVMTWNDDGPFE